jgi:two-component system, OmpR family, phosphate regulon sensor histidine kinase PhoR
MSWPPSQTTIAIMATICAAGLVLFLQHRAIATLRSQTAVIVRQLSEQTAADIAVELRRTLDGPVFDTLTAVNHPDLRAGRLDLVAQHFEQGLKTYPHVDRFFAWSAQRTEPATPGEVVFYGRNGRFTRDAALGRAVTALARRHAPSQQIYVAAEGIGPDSRYQVFLRLFWSDARRLDYFAILGFVVDPSTMREQLFGALRHTRLDALLARRGGDLPLQLAVRDEAGALVYGTAAASTQGGRVPFEMLFYPADEIHSRLAASVAPRTWTIEVTAPAATGAFTRASQEYGPTALSVVLMLVALGLTVQAHRRSADLAQMQTDFVAHVSHQLKTPLSLLSAATETLQMDRVRSPERFAEYLATIHAEAARLSLLVQRVLEFSRVQQRRTYEVEQVDLGALVRETVDAFAHSLSSQHFRFDVQQDGPGPVVLADPAALEQVLVNLLDNAVKYSADIKEITVRVRTSRSSAIVEITDRGVGIAPSDHARVFERFYRASGAPHRPGFGLGLPIVREVIQAHRGHVEVVSAPGEGSTFRIALPLYTGERLTDAVRRADTSKVAS